MTILHREPDAAEEQRHRDRAAQADAWFLPVVAPPLQAPWRRVRRWVHVQRSAKVEPGMAGSCLGKVPWETHAAACEAMGVDAERNAARGGLGWDEMATALGEAPGVWVAW